MNLLLQNIASVLQGILLHEALFITIIDIIYVTIKQKLCITEWKEGPIKFYVFPIKQKKNCRYTVK